MGTGKSMYNIQLSFNQDIVTQIELTSLRSVDREISCAQNLWKDVELTD